MTTYLNNDGFTSVGNDKQVKKYFDNIAPLVTLSSGYNVYQVFIECSKNSLIPCGYYSGLNFIVKNKRQKYYKQCHYVNNKLNGCLECLFIDLSNDDIIKLKELVQTCKISNFRWEEKTNVTKEFLSMYNSQIKDLLY